MVQTRRAMQQSGSGRNSNGVERASAEQRDSASRLDSSLPPERRSSRIEVASNVGEAPATTAQQRFWSERELALLMEVAEVDTTRNNMVTAYQRAARERGLATRSTKAVYVKLTTMRDKLARVAAIRPQLQPRGREPPHPKNEIRAPHVATVHDEEASETDSDVDVPRHATHPDTRREVHTAQQVGGRETREVHREFDLEMLGEIAAAASSAAVAALYSYGRRVDQARRPQP